MIQDFSSMDRAVERSPLWRRMPVLVSAALLIAAIVSAILLAPGLQRWASADRAVELSRLRLGVVQMGDLTRDVSVQGRVVAADSPTLPSPAQGVVTIRARAGDVVHRGQVLASIESPELENRLLQEQSAYRSLETELERERIDGERTRRERLQEIGLLEVRLQAAERGMERSRELFEEGLGNAIDFERTRDDVRVIQMELEHVREKLVLEKETLEFELRNRRLQLDRQELVVSDMQRQISRLAVTSPVDGLVARVEVKDKDTVQPNQALLSVVDLSEFQVEVLIPENFAHEIGPGTQAVVVDDGNEYAGEVRSLSPEVEASQVRGIVAFVAGAPAALKQNQRVQTRLILESRPRVLKVPRGPFLESMGGRGVYVVEQGLARLRPIQVGAVSVTEVEIRSGLAEGERIVLTDLSRYERAETLLLR